MRAEAEGSVGVEWERRRRWYIVCVGFFCFLWIGSDRVWVWVRLCVWWLEWTSVVIGWFTGFTKGERGRSAGLGSVGGDGLRERGIERDRQTCV